MLVLIVLALVTFVLGLLFLAGQEKLKKLDSLMNKTIIKVGSKELTGSKDKLVGILLVGFAVILLIVGLSLKK